MKKINVITLGCSKNTVDSEHLMARLAAAGYEVLLARDRPHAKVVLIYPSGLIKVVDLDELADAVEQKLITTEQLLDSLLKLYALLRLIYDGTLLPALEDYWPED